MTFEKDINKLNEDFFFKEFTYSTATFRPHPSKEIELADGIIWLDEILVVFQLKERQLSTPTKSTREENGSRIRSCRGAPGKFETHCSI